MGVCSAASSVCRRVNRWAAENKSGERIQPGAMESMKTSRACGKLWRRRAGQRDMTHFRSSACPNLDLFFRFSTCDISVIDLIYFRSQCFPVPRDKCGMTSYLSSEGIDNLGRFSSLSSSLSYPRIPALHRCTPHPQLPKYKSAQCLQEK